MKLKHLPLLGLLLLIISVAVIPGVFATWQYSNFGPDPKSYSFTPIVEQYKFNGVVYVTDAVKWNGDGEVLVTKHDATTITSTVTLTNDTTSFVTLTITVYNSASETYAFNAVKYTAEHYSNTDIVYELPALQHGDPVEAGKSLSFDVIFAYKAGVEPINTTLDSILNFDFVKLSELPEDEEEIAVSGALGQFEDILNGNTISDSLAQLTNQMDDFDANDRHDDSYIGNVTGATDEDSMLLENLFQDNLTLLINGVETSVTILIKRENVDGNANTGDASGREMTIYMTTSDLQQTGSWLRPASATVFASVFTSNDDGKTWSQVGEMHEGTATIKQYNGWYGGGSFDTDTWKSLDGKTIEQLV